MKVIGARVLVEETMTKKRSKIITLDNKDPNTFDVDMIILALGNGCPKDTIVKPGDIPILESFTDTNTKKIIEATKNKVVTQFIVNYENIAGIDD
jgi:hypothetical protein